MVYIKKFGKIILYFLQAVCVLISFYMMVGAWFLVPTLLGAIILYGIGYNV